MEEMRRVDMEQQQRIAEKFRRELVARDRQIESLEEQLSQYNDSSIRRLKRGKMQEDANSLAVECLSPTSASGSKTDKS
jgi:hypothetical protein